MNYICDECSKYITETETCNHLCDKCAYDGLNVFKELLGDKEIETKKLEKENKASKEINMSLAKANDDLKAESERQNKLISEFIYNEEYPHSYKLREEIERENEILKEALSDLVFHCAEYDLSAENFALAMEMDKACAALEKIKELK